MISIEWFFLCGFVVLFIFNPLLNSLGKYRKKYLLNLLNNEASRGAAAQSVTVKPSKID